MMASPTKIKSLNATLAKYGCSVRCPSPTHQREIDIIPKKLDWSVEVEEDRFGLHNPKKTIDNPRKTPTPTLTSPYSSPSPVKPSSGSDSPKKKSTKGTGTKKIKSRAETPHKIKKSPLKFSTPTDSPQTSPEFVPIAAQTDGYLTYINSEEFEDTFVVQVVEKCVVLANQSSRPVKIFWRSHITLLRNLLAERHYTIVRSILRDVQRGPEIASACLRGLLLGQKLEQETHRADILKELEQTTTSLSVTAGRILREKIDKEQQSIEFARQISASSKCVADFQKTVEGVKLQLAKLAVIPSALALPDPDLPIMDPSEDGISTPETAPFELPIKVIEGDGFYLTDGMSVKLQGGKVTSIDTQDLALEPLKLLIGKTLRASAPFLNADLIYLGNLGATNPSWLKDLLEDRSANRVERAARFLRSIRIKPYQWKIRNPIL